MFSPIKAALRDFTTYFNLTTKKGRVRAGAVVISLLIIGIVISSQGAESDLSSATQAAPRTVELYDLQAVKPEAMFSSIGQVRALSEVELLSEASGRVTSLSVSLGDSVAAGTVIARLENSAAYASLLQAEGSYEAALAAAAISEVSVAEAETNYRSALVSAKTTIRASVTTLNTLFTTELDTIFADNANVYRTPGFRSAEDGPVVAMIDEEFRYFSNYLPQLQQRVLTLSDEAIQPTIDEVSTTVTRLERVITTLESLIVNTERQDAYDANAASYLSTLSTVSQQLSGVVSQLTTTSATVENRAEALTRAELGGTTPAISSANAQVKQALGSLRAAQSNYNKTIITTPISGDVAALPITLGSFVSTNQTVATVVNADTYEIITSVDGANRTTIAVGDTVTIDNGQTGRVSAIAPGLLNNSGKVEVRVVSTDQALISGEQVTVDFSSTSIESEGGDTTLRVPLNAVKFQSANAKVFSVNEGTLIAHDVTVGSPQGDTIEVLSGLSSLTSIVADVRGLTEGMNVTVR